MNFSKLAFPWTFSEASFPFYREWSLRSLQNAPSCREDVLHDEGQLSPVNPKNFYQVALVDRALHLHFSTLEKARIDHNPVNSLIFTFQRVAPLYRQEQVCQDLDIHARTSPGLLKLKKTRTKAFLRSNSS